VELAAGSMEGVLLHGAPKQLTRIAGKPVSQWTLEDSRNAGASALLQAARIRRLR
jgi:dTDP-glucose pyrophosphorylase